MDSLECITQLIVEKDCLTRLAYQRDLYTTFAGSREVDEFERWIAAEFEEPGLEAVQKLVAGTRLTTIDWRSLARFVAAQDVRTPLNFIESMKRWDQEIPRILEETLRDAVKKLQAAKNQGVRIEVERKLTAFDNSFRIRIEPPPDPASDQALLRVEVLIGRGLWLASIRHLLTNTANGLCQHRWSVVKPCGDEEWPLTDHPVLRLNYYRPGEYDFRGGWGNPGSEVIMPVSPRQLLYVQVGNRAPNRFTFSTEQTQVVQRFLAERAHRWVFARRPMPWVARVKPRVIDAARALAEEEGWRRWHEEQLHAEVLRSSDK